MFCKVVACCRVTSQAKKPFSLASYKLLTRTFTTLRTRPSQVCTSYPLKQVCCSFRVKAGGRVEGVSENRNPSVSEEEISKAVSSLTRKLHLDKQEVMSVRLGLQEGLRMQGSLSYGTKPEKRSFNTDTVLITLISVGMVIAVAVVLATLTTVASPLKRLVSMSKDFKAEIPDVTFDDVKGIDEVKQELKDVVEFLGDPERFTNLGAKLPKGVLLVGSPGTGKTLLARAIAGEAGVPFYYAAGSEFDEMFVGVGSARIRALFAEAKEHAPCIIFIDEIDACGSARSSNPLTPYARMTINQLLQEMDGFEGKEGIIVIGATNMGKVLDKALTRPGRFDSEVKVLPPDITGRKEILEFYASKIICGSDINLEKIARLTGGMTGADLSNLVNQAALRAAQLQKPFVDMRDFEFALDKLRLGPELKSRLRTEKELENTAYHEAGHALVAFHTPGAFPLYKVTIGQRGGALGHTSMIPDQEDENNLTKAKISGKIDVAMGGRVAEEILSGSNHVTTGASSDLEVATALAYQLVCDFGMSESLGFVAYDLKTVSPQNKRIIETEVSSILTASYDRAKQLLSKYSSQHRLLAKALLKYETLSLNEIKAIFENNSLEAVQKLRENSGTVIVMPNAVLPM